MKFFTRGFLLILASVREGQAVLAAGARWGHLSRGIHLSEGRPNVKLEAALQIVRQNHGLILGYSTHAIVFMQGCHVFHVRDFVDGQGNLEKTWKVREFENKWLRQAVCKKLIYSVQEGKGCTFS